MQLCPWHVAELAVAQIDPIEPGVEVDFVETVAAPVRIRVIAEMLGVSTEFLDDFRRWSDAFIGSQSPIARRSSTRART